MMTISDRFSRLVLSGSFLLVIPQICLAMQWQPYKFKGDERFEYRIEWSDNGEKTGAIYILDIRSTNEKNEEGEKVFEISYTTKGKVSQDELGEQAAFGLWGMYGISLPILFLNPMYAVFFGQMNLETGEKMSLYGMGVIKVTKKESVGKREGFVCQLIQEDELMSEWTIDPDLALPIRSRLYEEGETKHQIELIGYTKY
jgi:hypothetical protein